MEYPTAYLILFGLLPTAYKAAFENLLPTARLLISYFQTLVFRRALEFLNGFLDQNLILVCLSQVTLFFSSTSP